ncbi:hypothetical protein H4I96_03862 [Botrytis cinerea]
MRFLLSLDGDDKKEINVALTHDVHFVTAHPCVKSHSIEVLKSPTSPLFQQNGDESGQIPNPNMGMSPLHKAFTYAIIPLHHILTSPASKSLSSLLVSPPRSPVEGGYSATIQASTHTTTSNIPKVLVIDCASTMLPPSPPDETDVDLNVDAEGEIGIVERKKEFGSDAEMLVRALCAERGWNALISRRRRSCLACAIREAGAIGWGVVIRV